MFASPTSMRWISSSSRRTWAAAARRHRTARGGHARGWHACASASCPVTRVRAGRRPYVQYWLRCVRVNTIQHARLALGELEAPLRVDDDAWLYSERGQDRRLALDPHVLPMDEFGRNARIELLTRRSLRLTAKQERIAKVVEANPASLVTVRVDGRERELTNHHKGTGLSVAARANFCLGWYGYHPDTPAGRGWG